MENYIQISKINDFIFCPKSLYLHSIYENFTNQLYHDIPQTAGKIVHESIDNAKYSTEKKYLQGISIYSNEFQICGKIDIFDKENNILIERKNKISRIYEGYRYQLYAQYFCLKEMGYKVKKMYLHSISDNKKYEISIPDSKEVEEFNKVLNQIINFNIEKCNIQKNTTKCKNCIYSNLCF